MTNMLSILCCLHIHQVRKQYILVDLVQVVLFRVGKHHILFVCQQVYCLNQLRMVSMMYDQVSLGMFLVYIVHMMFVLLFQLLIRLRMVYILFVLVVVRMNQVHRLYIVLVRVLS
jgi:hypothetical protein